MASQPYPMGTWPIQSIGGGIKRSKFAVGSGGNQFTGGTVFAGGTLQNNKLFDSTWGVLNWPYLGIHNAYNDNKPVIQNDRTAAGLGITKALSAGKFATMVAGQYVILTFNSQLAGVATSVLKSPSRSQRSSQNVSIGWINSTTYWKNNNGGFWLYNGLPYNPTLSRDNINTETYPGTLAIPGRLTYFTGAPKATVDSFKAKSD